MSTDRQELRALLFALHRDFKPEASNDDIGASVARELVRGVANAGGQRTELTIANVERRLLLRFEAHVRDLVRVYRAEYNARASAYFYAMQRRNSALVMKHQNETYSSAGAQPNKNGGSTALPAPGVAIPPLPESPGPVPFDEDLLAKARARVREERPWLFAAAIPVSAELRSADSDVSVARSTAAAIMRSCPRLTMPGTVLGAESEALVVQLARELDAAGLVSGTARDCGTDARGRAIARRPPVATSVVYAEWLLRREADPARRQALLSTWARRSREVPATQREATR